MSFRLKTVVGIAIIEGFLLLILLWSSSATLEHSTQEELRKRAETAVALLDTTARDAILSTDLATLESFVQQVQRNPDFVYARIRGYDDVVLAAAGSTEVLAIERKPDRRTEDVDDGVYDVSIDVLEGGVAYGRIEVGLSTEGIAKVRDQARRQNAFIAVMEMLLVAMFSILLGSYLTRELSRLEQAAHAVASGDLGRQVEVHGTDELARTIHSFNHMSRRVRASYEELKESEERHRASQQRLDGIVGSLLEGVCLLDAEHRVLFANPVAEKYLRLLRNSEVENGHVTHLGDREIEQLLVSNEVSAFALKVERDSEEHIFELTTRPVTNRTSEESEWVLVLRDVTAERRSRERIQEHERMAAVGQLAAGIAHDFNNILSVIMGLSELTLMSEELPKGVRGDLHAIYTQGERAAELVRQILDFSRKVDARKERLELSRFVESTLDLLTRTAPSNVKFVLDLEPNSGEIEFNATKLQQVLANLIVNAVHAMPSGGTITIRTERRHIQRTDPEAVSIPCGNWACLSVGDTGMGMSKETAARIFEPFFTTKPAGQGTGLGLAQVYGLITKNGGELDVRSELGVGSTFTIFLPEAGSSSAPGATVLGFAASGSGQTS